MVRSVAPNTLATCLLVLPRMTSSKTSRSRGVNFAIWVRTTSCWISLAPHYLVVSHGPFNCSKKLFRRYRLGENIFCACLDSPYRGLDIRKAVRNTIGKIEPISLKRRCSSGPLSPGIRTSSKMQPNTFSLGKELSRCWADGWAATS